LVSRVPANVEIVPGDVLDPASLSRAMKGVEATYYLVHSMGTTGDFEAEDRIAADNFGAAARAAGVRRIIYLGGLGEDDPRLSAHLRSRHEVGKRLRAHGVPVIELRASIIIGSGSLSFELIRALVERLPVMVTPRWVRVKAQPIAIGDVLEYLHEALTVETGNRSLIIEIGGPDRVSYQELMYEYARQRGLRRWMIPVPVLTPRLSSLWLGLITPLYARVGRKLIDSLRHPTSDPTWYRPTRCRSLVVPAARESAWGRGGIARGSCGCSGSGWNGHGSRRFVMLFALTARGRTRRGHPLGAPGAHDG
jgi:uncharacterized protein YbjT (DUF2867 family)